MHQRLLCAAMSAAMSAAMLGAAVPALAQEALLIGRVERITLQPLAAPGCADPCAQAPAADAGRVCITNQAGCQQTDLRIERVLLGADAAGLKTYRQALGEWGRPTFPVSHRAILVHVRPDATQWSELVERDGKLYFDAAAFRRDPVVGGAAVAALAGADGSVALDDLLAAIKAPR